MLNLYRRHRAECEAGHGRDFRSGEFEERKKSWKRCACFVFASGTLGGKFQRKNTTAIEWEAAKTITAAWEQAGSWDGKSPAPLPAPPTSDQNSVPSPTRLTIAEAFSLYKTNREAANIKESTFRKYRTFAKQLTAFADSRGYVMLDQFTTADIDVFYSAWKLRPRAKRNGLGMLRGFFRFCTNRKWIKETPVSTDLKPPIGANSDLNKVPFTNADLERINYGCDRIGVIEWSNGRKTGTWDGEDVKDIDGLMLYTGLRISDVVLFDMDRLTGNVIFLRAHKNGGKVETWIPDWLVERLKRRAQKYGSRPFILGDSQRLETMTDLWRRRINRAFELAGKWEETPTPHRFRHTFARVLLQKNVSPRKVGELMGDTEATILKHYSRWVPERQEEITNTVKDAFIDTPKPTPPHRKLVAMPDRRRG